jgi:hypothetical protein
MAPAAFAPTSDTPFSLVTVMQVDGIDVTIVVQPCQSIKPCLRAGSAFRSLPIAAALLK